MIIVKVYAAERILKVLGPPSMDGKIGTRPGFSDQLGCLVVESLSTQNFKLRSSDYIVMLVPSYSLNGAAILVEVNGAFTGIQNDLINVVAKKISQYVVEKCGILGAFCVARVSMGRHEAHAQSCFGSGIS